MPKILYYFTLVWEGIAMKIKCANVSDAPIIHYLLIEAFMEYKNEVPPSSALDETIQSISTALENGEQALIGYSDEEPVGMVRFQIKEDHVYFSRLSVIPERQGQGIAKKLLSSLEICAKQKEKSTIWCKVRMTVPKNINLYRSMGYGIYDEKVVHKPSCMSVKVVSMKKQLI